MLREKCLYLKEHELKLNSQMKALLKVLLQEKAVTTYSACNEPLCTSRCDHIHWLIWTLGNYYLK